MQRRPPAPTANAFLHITDDDNGVNISPGYYITPNDSRAKSGLALGITSTDGYNVVKLTANKDVPGDFLPQSGTYKFPKAATPNTFTGNGLLDTGSDSMFLDLPRDQWPAGTFDSNDKVPVKTPMEVSMGPGPAMHYEFTLEGPPPSGSPGPVSAKWVNITSAKPVFIKTGRRPLFDFDYFYDGQDGRVGFLKLGK